MATENKKQPCERILKESPAAREKRLLRQKAHYQKNKEKYLKRYREEYHQNIESSRRKAATARSQETPKQREHRLSYLREYQKDPDRKARARELQQSDRYKYTQYQNQSALRRKKIFELNFEQFVELYHGDCYLCGTENSKGIDRVDNSKGYTYENSKSCCSLCNKLKWAHDKQLLLSHILKIVQHHNMV